MDKEILKDLDFEIGEVKERTKEPIIKSIIQEVVADKKPITLKVSDIKFIDDEETKEVRGIVHHHYTGRGAKTLVIIDDIILRGETIDGVFYADKEMEEKV